MPSIAPTLCGRAVPDLDADGSRHLSPCVRPAGHQPPACLPARYVAADPARLVRWWLDAATRRPQAVTR